MPVLKMRLLSDSHMPSIHSSQGICSTLISEYISLFFTQLCQSTINLSACSDMKCVCACV